MAAKIVSAEGCFGRLVNSAFKGIPSVHLQAKINSKMPWRSSNVCANPVERKASSETNFQLVDHL
jgi:hypothetical protein